MSGEKTEEPSPKKLRKAREEGNVAKSRDFTSGVAFVVACAVIAFMGEDQADQVKVFARECFAASARPDDIPDIGHAAIREGGILVLKVSAPLLATLFAISLFMGYIQVGSLITLKPLMPKLDKLNPIAGIKNMFAKKALVELLKNLLKISVAFYLAYAALADSIREIVASAAQPLAQNVQLTSQIVGGFLKKICGFFLVVGALDLLYQRWQHKKDLMMSKQEVKDEYKQDEGDPHHKAKRKQFHKEILSAKAVQEVKKAKVVVVNPHQIAVALDYDPEKMDAPQVLAKGERLIAEQILKVARENNVPIMQNIPLAHALNDLEIGDEIPADLYDAVAEVMNWVYSLAQES